MPRLSVKPSRGRCPELYVNFMTIPLSLAISITYSLPAPFSFLVVEIPPTNRGLYVLPDPTAHGFKSEGNIFAAHRGMQVFQQQTLAALVSVDVQLTGVTNA